LEITNGDHHIMIDNVLEEGLGTYIQNHINTEGKHTRKSVALWQQHQRHSKDEIWDEAPDSFSGERGFESHFVLL
jgi:hypothetical protein